MTNQKQKSLYSFTENGIQISVRCNYNQKTDNILIYSGFYKNNYKNTGVQKHKNIYSKTENGVTTRIECIYNLNTDHISIHSSFGKSYGNSGGSKTNIHCSSYLGIYIAEKVLSKIFKNVKRMDNNNHGYDFVCNNGYKIDVKSAVSTGNTNNWKFSIKKNTTADYFLCLAFDNRYNLNPTHLWLIPGHVLNDKVGITIMRSNLQRWSQYEQSIDKVISCCNTLRDDKE